MLMEIIDKVPNHVILHFLEIDDSTDPDIMNVFVTIF